MTYWIISIIVLYLIIARIDLGVNTTEFENHRIVRGGGIFGGNSLECDEHHRKPTRADVLYSALWPLRSVWYLICLTLYVMCEFFYASESRFAKRLEKFL